MDEKIKIVIKKCLNCNKSLSIKQKRFCSHKCYHIFRKGKTKKEVYGEKWKSRSIFVKCDYCSKDMKVYPGIQRLRKHQFCDRNCYRLWRRVKSNAPMFGKHHTEETKRKIGNRKPVECIRLHYEEILKQTKILEEQGFRCVPIGKVIPDIIAIKGKDIQVFAVEVEKTVRPNWDKYIDSVKTYFDDIIWIWLRYGKKKIKFNSSLKEEDKNGSTF